MTDLTRLLISSYDGEERGNLGLVNLRDHLRFLARNFGQLSDADARLVIYPVDREGWLDDDGDD